MALSNSQGIVATTGNLPGSGALSGGVAGAASRISVVKSRQQYGGSAVPDSAVRSVTTNLRIAYPGVEGNITDV
jgi:hypothetical protein